MSAESSLESLHVLLLVVETASTACATVATAELLLTAVAAHVLHTWLWHLVLVEAAELLSTVSYLIRLVFIHKLSSV